MAASRGCGRGHDVLRGFAGGAGTGAQGTAGPVCAAPARRDRVLLRRGGHDQRGRVFRGAEYRLLRAAAGAVSGGGQRLRDIRAGGRADRGGKHLQAGVRVPRLAHRGVRRHGCAGQLCDFAARGGALPHARGRRWYMHTSRGRTRTPFPTTSGSTKRPPSGRRRRSATPSRDSDCFWCGKVGREGAGGSGARGRARNPGSHRPGPGGGTARNQQGVHHALGVFAGRGSDIARIRERAEIFR